MSPTAATFLFEIVNFLLLAGLLGWLLFKPVRTALETRQAAEKTRADQLAAGEAKMASDRAELEKRRAAFDEELAKLRTERLAAAEKESAALVARARETAERERDRQTRLLGHLEQAELERLAAATADAARVAVEHFLTSLGAPDLDAGLVRAACRQVAALDGASLGSVLIESARPLGDDTRKALMAAVKDRAAGVEERVVADLGAGVRVTTARGLIDATAVGVAAAAGRALTEALRAPADEGAHE
jgi:F-type H+-transporting ATPase subunit b